MWILASTVRRRNRKSHHQWNCCNAIKGQFSTLTPSPHTYIFNGNAWLIDLFRKPPWLPIKIPLRLPGQVPDRCLLQVLNHAWPECVRDFIHQPRRQCSLRVTVRHVAQDATAWATGSQDESCKVGRGSDETFLGRIVTMFHRFGDEHRLSTWSCVQPGTH